MWKEQMSALTHFKLIMAGKSEVYDTPQTHMRGMGCLSCKGH